MGRSIGASAWRASGTSRRLALTPARLSIKRRGSASRQSLKTGDNFPTVRLNLRYGIFQLRIDQLRIDLKIRCSRPPKAGFRFGKSLRTGWRAFGGSLWFIRWLGPVFRIGRNPAVSLFLGRKIPDMRDGAISSTYGNGPTTVLDHFRVKFGFLAHPKNTRLQQNGSIPNSTAKIQTEH